MGVASWVRPPIEHAQEVLSGELGQDWEYNFMLFFFGGGGVLFVFKISCLFYYCFFFLSCLGCALFSKIKSFVLGLSFDFLVFCDFVFRLESSLQKNNLTSSKLLLIQFGYRGFSFLGHAVRL